MITAELVREHLDYNPDTGIFLWKKRCGIGSHVRIGSVAGSSSKKKHVQIRIFNRMYKAHRLAWLYMTGDMPPDQIDHKDLDRTNNKWDNLRLASRSQNGANRRSYKHNPLGLKGVTLAPSGKYKARIQKDRKITYLGRFDTPEDAHARYCEEADKIYGEFARHS